MTQAERGKYQSVKAYWHDNDAAEKQSVIGNFSITPGLQTTGI
jgi:hypothetical protein